MNELLFNYVSGAVKPGDKILSISDSIVISIHQDKSITLYNFTLAEIFITENEMQLIMEIYAK